MLRAAIFWFANKVREVILPVAFCLVNCGCAFDECLDMRQAAVPVQHWDFMNELYYVFFWGRENLQIIPPAQGGAERGVSDFY